MRIIDLEYDVIKVINKDISHISLLSTLTSALTLTWCPLNRECILHSEIKKL